MGFGIIRGFLSAFVCLVEIVFFIVIPAIVFPAARTGLLIALIMGAILVIMVYWPGKITSIFKWILKWF